ncbi:LysR family transcriptional regulator [Pelagovum pacificum]|uniref:LysR family transcriptional regulator n=1 Tax=Pelagovum pacificum TaxID=2588711 RepID=A0A5C5GDX6_9RHOB|nr:LysR family transcriptional regulator [Pelagovum pacificum]QQA44663.1 LysR family transcriptional regulator [Pelagovum pacificum]TNY32227.1 LysR family transcriptional regulator [Pelagovum pacificum]
MQKESWDDLRFVLAVAETGSVAGAARELGVNHATVLRRIAAFEARAGQPVFERTPHGYRLPPDQFRLIEAARDVAAAVDGVERLVSGRSGQRQAVRITSTDTLCTMILPPIVAELARAGTQIDLRCSNRHLDLSRMHADITVRPAKALPPDLTGEIAGHLGLATYASSPDVSGWLTAQGPLAKSVVAEWQADQGSTADSSGGADSFLVLRELAAQGLGRTMLPCCVGEADPRLVRISDPDLEFSVPVWVASHVELGDVARLRQVRERLVAALGAQSRLLSSGQGRAAA